MGHRPNRIVCRVSTGVDLQVRISTFVQECAVWVMCLRSTAFPYVVANHDQTG